MFLSMSLVSPCSPHTNKEHLLRLAAVQKVRGSSSWPTLDHFFVTMAIIFSNISKLACMNHRVHQQPVGTLCLAAVLTCSVGLGQSQSTDVDHCLLSQAPLKVYSLATATLLQCVPFLVIASYVMAARPHRCEWHSLLSAW